MNTLEPLLRGACQGLAVPGTMAKLAGTATSWGWAAEFQLGAGVALPAALHGGMRTAKEVEWRRGDGSG